MGAGYTGQSASSTCSGSVASCSTGTCCTATTGTCAATSVSCPTGKYKDSTKNGVTAGTTTTAQQDNCCTTKATCADFHSYNPSATASGAVRNTWLAVAVVSVATSLASLM